MRFTAFFSTILAAGTILPALGDPFAEVALAPRAAPVVDDLFMRDLPSRILARAPDRRVKPLSPVEPPTGASGPPKSAPGGWSPFTLQPGRPIPLQDHVTPIPEFPKRYPLLPNRLPPNIPRHPNIPNNIQGWKAWNFAFSTEMNKWINRIYPGTWADSLGEEHFRAGWQTDRILYWEQYQLHGRLRRRYFVTWRDQDICTWLSEEKLREYVLHLNPECPPSSLPVVLPPIS